MKRKQITSTAALAVEKTVEWWQLEEANAIFGDDLWLVQKPQTPKIGLFDRPFGSGTYSLTDLWLLNESDFASRVRDEEVIMLLGCMDQAFARFVYDSIKRANRRALIASYFCAGGAAQWDNERRVGAMQKILAYICENARVTQIIATAHTDNCGGLGHFAMEGQKVTHALKCKPNSREEANFVKNRVNLTIPLIVPSSHQGRVAKYLVSNRKHPGMTPF